MYANRGLNADLNFKAISTFRVEIMHKYFFDNRNIIFYYKVKEMKLDNFYVKYNIYNF